MRRTSGVGSAALLAALVLAGCGGRQNVLDPHSHAARRIDSLWWWMLGGASIGFGVVAALLFAGWVRRNRTQLPFGGGDRVATGLVVGLGIAVPVVVLTILFVWADLFVLKSTAAPPRGATRLTVRVIGHQWFWEVRYPGTRAVTANEMHIPVGVPVKVIATTADVIHSFWVPELNRKIDMIPGRGNRIELDATRPGVYRGQCSEFCGLQHAHMSFLVYADPPARFRAWLRDAARPARRPASALQRRGQEVFRSSSCSACHAIRGTSAVGRVGPDLTHVAGRQTLAAVTIRNTPAELAEWIREPQHVKPGNRMPAVAPAGVDFRALLAYLESLR